MVTQQLSANSKARESGQQFRRLRRNFDVRRRSGYVLEGSINYVIYRGGRGRKFEDGMWVEVKCDVTSLVQNYSKIFLLFRLGEGLIL
jgi:hypothetical protein